MVLLRLATFWTLALLLWLAADASGPGAGLLETHSNRMSFHNRLLLNRAVVSGLEAIDVMMLARGESSGAQGPSRAATAVGRAGVFGLQMQRIITLADRLGGRVRQTDSAVGYLRIEVPTARLLECVGSPDIVAYQISSLSRASWYRDGPPQSNARMHRGFEIAAPRAMPPAPDGSLPPLSWKVSRQPGYTGDDDTGIREWMRAHPTFDGRGVTIALLETAMPSFMDPTLGTALTLDGREVPKLAGILNTIDPEMPDGTRVLLNEEIRAATSWARVGGRTYILPRHGTFRFGLFNLPAGVNLIHQFGVLEDTTTGEIRIDSNGNADFQDEAPSADVNERFEPRTLRLTHPAPRDISFVMARGRSPHTVHIYVAAGSHQAMTLSVAAGSRTPGSLAYGVAPNARVLLVRTQSVEYRLADLFEGYLEAVRRPDVDVLSDSAGIAMVPDTAADFTGLLFRRMAAAYGKPMFSGAGNNELRLNSAKLLQGGFSVGGSLGPSTFDALYAGGRIDATMVHQTGAAGPSLDGAIKPDFLAPMHRIAADLPENVEIDRLPRNAPASRLPAGYQISCCTSATSPYAAGVAALLISGARQRGMPHSLDSLGRAMRIGARFLPGWPSHQQGHGVLDVNAAWRELTQPLDIPRIVASAAIVHPLAQYAAQGPRGQGILEFTGWAAGMHGTRDIQLRRESGAVHPISYRLSWTGNDGTFAGPAAVTLPLDTPVALTVAIDVKRTGVHSAILNLHEPASGRIVFRTQVTVVASERLTTSSRAVRLAGRVPLMRTRSHHLALPAGVGALSVELEVLQGTVRAAIVPSHGLFPSYYQHLYPGVTRPFSRGTYNVLLPNPEQGTWTISITNDSVLHPLGAGITSSEDAIYTIAVKVLSASVLSVRPRTGTLEIDVQNTGAALGAPVVHVSAGTLVPHRGTFRPAGLPNTFEIEVPENATALALQLRAAGSHAADVEMYLYDCTSGECFSYDLGFPAAAAHTMIVRRPGAGRWIAAVNPAPFPVARGEFVLDEIIVTGAARRSDRRSTPRLPGSRWSETVDVEALQIPAGSAGTTPILFLELIDLARERDEAARPWDPRPGVPRLRDRPVAIGTAIHRLH